MSDAEQRNGNDDGGSYHKTYLLARLDSVDVVPHFLSGPISSATRITLGQLRIVLVSPLFDTRDSTEGPSALGTTRWDNVQSILTYVYVQATKVAQELNRILMDIDVLLLGQNDTLPESVTTDAQLLCRCKHPHFTNHGLSLCDV